MRLRALSPLLATIILIAIVLSAGLVVYGMLSGWMSTYSSTLSVQPTSVDLVVAGDKALLSVSVKNTGNKPLAGIVVTGYDDNGKPFKLALSPADPGQVSGNTLVIPLGVSNIVLDASGNNNHGTIYGATWVDGKVGGALSFDGVDDYVEVPDSPSLRWDMKPFTITFWAKETTVREHELFRSTITTNVGYWRIWFSTGTGPLYFSTRSSDTNELLDFSAAVRPSGWFHAALVREDPIWKWYLNGNLSATTTDTRTGRGMAFKGILIGAKLYTAYFNGLIDEVRVYNRAFDGGEVSFSNANPGLPPTRGLVAWYPMDEGTNAPFSFTAGSSYALTITAYSLDGSVATQTLTIRATG